MVEEWGGVVTTSQCKGPLIPFRGGGRGKAGERVKVPTAMKAEVRLTLLSGSSVSALQGSPDPIGTPGETENSSPIPPQRCSPGVPITTQVIPLKHLGREYSSLQVGEPLI